MLNIVYPNENILFLTKLLSNSTKGKCEL